MINILKVNPVTKLARRFKFEIITSIALCVTIIASYWGITEYDFINLDDEIFIFGNYHVRQGLSYESILWAFGFTDITYWQPLTWLSHMLDCQLFGLDPGKHHLVNLIIHIINTMILFAGLRLMSGSLLKSAVVSALFALHPLNIESVAWISERKNLLSASFWFLTMLSYSYYTRKPGFFRYLIPLIFFTLGLMTKPMVVTLPFALLLMDHWPLKRMKTDRKLLTRLIIEKIPFFILTASSLYITLQHLGGNVVSQTSVSSGLRIQNALVSYVTYLGKFFFPTNLAIFYPFPDTLPLWKSTSALFLLLFISVLAVMFFRKKPYIFTGWFWFTGTLFPAIGLIQGGLWPAIADRFVYIPCIGILFIIVWGAYDLTQDHQLQRKFLTVCFSAIAGILLVITYTEVRHWKNSLTIFQHTLASTENNFVAHNNLGVAFEENGDLKNARFHYKQALRIKPSYAEAHNNMGNILAAQNKNTAAEAHFAKALRINPDFAKAHNNMGNIKFKQNIPAKAIEHYLSALELNPYYANAHSNLGSALIYEGKIEEGIKRYKQALSIQPDLWETHTNLAATLLKQGALDDAKKHFIKAARLQPESPLPLFYLAKVYSEKKEYAQTIDTYKKIISSWPDLNSAYYNLACTYSKQGNREASIEWLKAAIEHGYDNFELIKQDPDLKNIREHDEYKKILSR